MTEHRVFELDDFLRANDWLGNYSQDLRVDDEH